MGSLTTLGLSCCVIVVFVAFVSFLLTRRRKDEYILFNNSRGKKALIQEAQRRFKARGWLIKRNDALVTLGVDFSVQCSLATFEVVCLDQALTHFLSEISILERFEKLARQLRLRSSCLIVVTDGCQVDGFSESARQRDLVLLQIAEIQSVTQIIGYVDSLPDAIGGVTLRAMESSPGACASLMYRFSKAGESAKAIEWGQRALKSHAGYFVHSALFSLLIEHGEFDLASKVGEEALSFKPKDASSFFRGFQKIATKKGNAPEAVIWAERWIKDEPDNSLPYVNLASVYQQQGNTALAVSNINRALELAPSDPNILRQAVLLLISNDDLQAAFLHATRWVSYASGDVEAHETLVDVLLKQARYDEAAVSVSDAMAIQGDRPSLLCKASFVALHQGDLPGSIKFAEHWRSVAPSDAWAHDHLSTIYLRGGRYELARVANSKALDLDPKNPNFRRRAEQIQARAEKAS